MAMKNFMLNYIQMQMSSWRNLQYTNCSLRRGGKSVSASWGAKLPLTKISFVLGMKWNCFWWWGTIPWTLGNAEYTFIAITPRSTVTQSCSTCEGLIYTSNRPIWKLFVFDRNTWYYITVCQKINNSKNININVHKSLPLGIKQPLTS